MKQDVWTKILQSELHVEIINDRPVLTSPFNDFKIGDKIICLYEPGEIFVIKRVNIEKKYVDATLDVALRTFYFNSILTVEEANKLYKELTKQVIQNRKVEEICKHCGREKLDHSAHNLSCPLGRKSKTVSFTQFSDAQVFELKEKSKGRGRKSSGVYEFLEDLLKDDVSYTLDEIEKFLKDKFPEKKTPAYNVLYDFRKKLQLKNLSLEQKDGRFSIVSCQKDDIQQMDMMVLKNINSKN